MQINEPTLNNINCEHTTIYVDVHEIHVICENVCLIRAISYHAAFSICTTR